MTTFYSDEIDSSANTERSTTSVVHRYSDAGANPRPSSATYFEFRCKTTNTGSLTAGVLSAALINISGTAGALYDCAIITNDATARTLRLQVVADGVTVFDTISASVASVSAAYWAVANGAVSSGDSINAPPIVFNSTLTVKVASSVTETDKTKLAYTYVTRA
jgi:hypothetical protein